VQAIKTLAPYGTIGVSLFRSVSGS
jgi:hypothetical protein